MTDPLFRSVAQALSPQGVRRSESYVVSSAQVPPFAGDALFGALANAGLPTLGSEHPQHDNAFIPLIVTDINVSPYGTQNTLVTYTYQPANIAGGTPATDATLMQGDISFSVYPTREEVTVPIIKMAPVSTVTQNQAGTQVVTQQPSFERADSTIKMGTARIVYTVSGTAEQLGISNNIGSVGNTPAIVDLVDQLHVIGGIALLFEGMDTSWNRTQAGVRIFTYTYRWKYEKGIRTTLDSLPDEWVIEPSFGPGSEREAVWNSRGSAPPNNDSTQDAFYGRAQPWLRPPETIRNLGHITDGRYLVVPYCRADTAVRQGADFAVPLFEAIPTFEGVDRSNPPSWANFPGVG